MDTIYRGDIATRAGRRNAWIDALFIDHALLRLGWTNFAVVEPGALYRSNHPVPFQLAKFTRDVGVRSLINLRGECRNGSDALSRDAAARLGLDFYDMALESRGAPQRDRILRIAGLYRDMKRPALVHCKSGADRAGLAAALFVLIEGGTVKQARAQLSWRFGHIRQSNTGILDAFLDEFERHGEGRKEFLDWVTQDYDEAALRASFASRGIGSLPRRLARFLNDKVLARE
ncbi:MAG: tyrosine-protein phosphatase [Acidiphilium sp.]|nr:tyrosine-protein phosphatase [Acidiphilium sp.]MDD4934398.1 tyrosine-protein phosphatase [Acidiphilium sp.]